MRILQRLALKKNRTKDEFYRTKLKFGSPAENAFFLTLESTILHKKITKNNNKQETRTKYKKEHNKLRRFRFTT